MINKISSWNLHALKSIAHLTCMYCLQTRSKEAAKTIIILVILTLILAPQLEMVPWPYFIATTAPFELHQRLRRMVKCRRHILLYVHQCMMTNIFKKTKKKKRQNIKFNKATFLSKIEAYTFSSKLTGNISHLLLEVKTCDLSFSLILT